MNTLAREWADVINQERDHARAQQQHHAHRWDCTCTGCARDQQDPKDRR